MIKNSLIPDMYFVHTLCYNGSIFYVGKTKDVHKRYLQHLNKMNKQKTSVFIQDIMSTGALPELNIITYANEIRASNIEETLIKCLSKGGQKLANVSHIGDSQGCKQMAGLSKKKEICNIIIENQNKFILIKSRFGAYYSVPTIK